MSNTKLCEPCKGFLRGTLEEWEYSDEKYRHHKTQKSFDIAIEIGCEICTQLYAAFLADQEFGGQKLPVERLDTTTVCPIAETVRDFYLPYIAYIFDCTGSDGYRCSVRLLLKPITGENLRNNSMVHDF